MTHRTSEPERRQTSPTGALRPTIVVLGLVAAMTLAYFLLPLDGLGPGRPLVSWVVFVALLAAVAVLLLRQMAAVFQEKPGTRPGVVIPLLMCLTVLVFSATYYALARQPGAFVGLRTRVDALYFTVVTLATVGFGDVAPKGQTARVVTVLQILYTFVFLTASATALTRRFRNRLGERPGAEG